VLVKGNVIERISTAPIAVAGALRIAGNGRTLMPGLIDDHWHAMLVRVTAAQSFGDVGYNNLVAGAEATNTLLRGFTTVRDVGGPVFGPAAPSTRARRGPAHLPVRHYHRHQRARGFRSADRSADDRSNARHGAGRWRDDRGQPDEVRVRARTAHAGGPCQVDGGRRGVVTLQSVDDHLSRKPNCAPRLKRPRIGARMRRPCLTPAAIRAAGWCEVYRTGMLMDEATAKLQAEKDVY
jgi:hypothetical protein